jgi:hypothetical protein
VRVLSPLLAEFLFVINLSMLQLSKQLGDLLGKVTFLEDLLRTK